MVDADTYARYSKPLEDQMFYLRDLGAPLHRAINAADAANVDHHFLSEVRQLKTKLEGQPGDGALEVYRDLPSDTAAAKEVLDRWHASPDANIQNVLDEVRRTYDALAHFQRLIDGTPPDVMSEIKATIAAQRGAKACFVATVVYPDPRSPELDVLRQYRDNVLLNTWRGRIYVRLYYGGIGEALSTLLRHHFCWLIPFLRIVLNRVVRKHLTTLTSQSGPRNRQAR